MEKLVAELKQIVAFKEDTNEGDIVVVAAKESQLLIYAAVGEIVRDETRKDEWWHVTLHLLTMPVQTVVWTLREPQFTGKEIFTMGGNPHFIKAIALPLQTDSAETQDSKQVPPPKKTVKNTRLTKIK